MAFLGRQYDGRLWAFDWEDDDGLYTDNDAGSPTVLQWFLL